VYTFYLQESETLLYWHVMVITEQAKKKAIIAVIGTVMTFIFVITGIFVSNRTSFDKRSDAADSGTVLTVNAGIVTSNFSKEMLGLAFVNWEHSKEDDRFPGSNDSSKKFLNQVPQLAETLQYLKPGVIRYAGGLWANSVGWDRVAQRPMYEKWTKNGQDYYFHYGIDEIDDLAAFSKRIGSKVMIQVNVANNDPAMWADMVRYTNIEKGYGFTYWELGNELDHDKEKNISAAEYANRVKAYQKALLAVDPSIKVITGVTAYTVEQKDDTTQLSPYLTAGPSSLKADGQAVQSVSYHWYQMCNGTNWEDLKRYQYDGLATTSWRNGYSRKWADIIPGRIQNEVLQGSPSASIGITELNTDACNYDNKSNNNQFGALWLGDVLGRLAYNGLDYNTLYTGYGSQGYSPIFKRAGYGDTTTLPSIRPTYYTLFMYANYFGDQMVQSSTSDVNNISIWASRDSKDPGKLKLMVTNLSGSNTTSKVDFNGFTAQSAQLYQLTSNASGTNLDQEHTPKLNGVTFDAASIASNVDAVKPVVTAVSGSSMQYTFPAYSVTSIILSGDAVTATTQPSPSSSPTVLVTASPTANPTASPTTAPSVSPTLVVTATPSASPSPTLTIVPVTATPSVAPSTSPIVSVSPTITASPMPSTTIPVTSTTIEPSAVPTGTMYPSGYSSPSPTFVSGVLPSTGVAGNDYLVAISLLSLCVSIFVILRRYRVTA
jgi:alpha-L-arabinofuranosidase